MSESALPNTDLSDESETLEGADRTAEATEVQPIEALSAATSNILARAAVLARGRGLEFVTTDDLFAAMITEQCAASRVLGSLGMQGDTLLRQLAFILGRNSGTEQTSEVAYSPKATRVLAQAKLEAGRRDAAEVSTLHLLTTLLRERSGVASLLLETPGLGLEPVGAALNRALREGMTDLS